MTTFDEQLARVKAYYGDILNELDRQKDKMKAELDTVILDLMYQHKHPNAAIELLKAGGRIYSLDMKRYYVDSPHFVPKDANDFELPLSDALHYGLVTTLYRDCMGDKEYVLTEAGKRYPDALTTAEPDAGSA
jgi:hypothetical protein